jgi:hypothetical protein
MITIRMVLLCLRPVRTLYQRPMTAISDSDSTQLLGELARMLISGEPVLRVPILTVCMVGVLDRLFQIKSNKLFG